jgi:hypothetical protein
MPLESRSPALILSSAGLFGSEGRKFCNATETPASTTVATRYCKPVELRRRVMVALDNVRHIFARVGEFTVTTGFHRRTFQQKTKQELWSL